VRTFVKVQRALAYAAAHLDEDLSLGVLARHADLSACHLQRVFAVATGETPKQLTLRLRLERAAAMLLTRNDSVLDVALSCGFQSHEVFSRTFRRHFRMTPSTYRARGFVNAGDPVGARTHAMLVSKVGPCIGLYHINKEPVRERNDMTYSIVKKDLQPQPVLVVRRRIKRSEIAATIAESLPHVFQYAQQHGIALAGLPFTRYVEMGPGLMTIEPGMRIAATDQNSIAIDPTWTRTAQDANVVKDTLPGGSVVTTTHMGSYEKLPEAYAAIQEWIEAKGLVTAGAPWECYVTDPAEYADPKDWKTDVFWPVSG
jgi:AraC family transcriptional regulator